jgi:hypothetical protein
MDCVRLVSAVDAERSHQFAHAGGLVIQCRGDVFQSLSGQGTATLSEGGTLTGGLRRVMRQQVVQAAAPLRQRKAWFRHQPRNSADRWKIDAARKAARSRKARTTGRAGEQFGERCARTHARIMP